MIEFTPSYLYYLSGSPAADGYAPAGENINHVDGSLEDEYVNQHL